MHTGDTLEAVVTRYFAHHERMIERRSSGRKRRTTMREERRVIDNDILPAVCDGQLMATMPVADFRPKHVMAMLLKIQQRGSMVMRDRSRAYLSNIFRFALHEGLIEMNPVTAVPKLAREQPRNRQFGKHELESLLRLWLGFEHLTGPKWEKQSPETPFFFVLGLLTLARRDELRLMEWSRIQSDGELVWRIPLEVKLPNGELYELVKNKFEHQVPLSSFARELLEKHLRPLTGKSRWVFPSPVRPEWPRSRTGFQKAKNRYVKEAGLKDVRVHDLKSIGASLMAELGVSEEIIGLCCNHKPRTITSRVYIRSQERSMFQRAEALERLGEYVRQIADGTADRAKLLPFPS